MITATIHKPAVDFRLSQCDVYRDLKVVESVHKEAGELTINYLSFPMAIVLNQDCDLNSDNRNNTVGVNGNTSLLHVMVAPVFLFDTFLEGTHWNGIFNDANKQKKKDTAVKKIMENSDPRYHYIHYLPSTQLPDMIIDFKHFFTINKQYLYEKRHKRLFSIDELFRERISQRFASYLSRIGLPAYDEKTEKVIIE